MRARARHRQRVSSPAPELGPVPFALPLEDNVPEFLPDVPLRGTASAPVSALLAWRAELDAAILECSNAAASLDAATSARSATGEGLQAAVAVHNAATTQESNAKARSSIALKRRRQAWDQFLMLLAEAHSDSGSLTPSESIDSASPAPGGNGKACASPSDTEDTANEYDEGFEGSSVDVLGTGGIGEEAMEFA